LVVRFAVDLSWACPGRVRSEDEERFNDVFRPLDDGEVCVWVDEVDRSLLRVEFDVDAPDYGAAIEGALREVRLAATEADLMGRCRSVVAMTEEGSVSWSE
jgi:hypothetical protein